MLGTTSLHYLNHLIFRWREPTGSSGEFGKGLETGLQMAAEHLKTVLEQLQDTKVTYNEETKALEDKVEELKNETVNLEAEVQESNTVNTESIELPTALVNKSKK